MDRKIKTYEFGNAPSLAFEDGGVLHGFDYEAAEVSGDAYRSKRARALFKAAHSTPGDEEMTLGVLPGGRWALVGCECEGHPFAVEVEPWRSLGHQVRKVNP